MRALARVFWTLYVADENRVLLRTKLEAFGQLDRLLKRQAREAAKS